ncbi:hypothetical protein PHMEG_0007836 [Phytophthora megakarya]|uniref:DUF6818 domain-containing protein n=1 Tax=Phytophthora megakarya TaxID=4795 RepID=A0A225WKP4_9STRA|nr:hypothetical protein PHMEG_0007836 [Phytophthora megakarya]
MPQIHKRNVVNYSMEDIERLLDLLNTVLPLGKAEWERVAMSFNTNRARGTCERDVESLRRKFKNLYGTRKPTGTGDMPPLIRKAKEVKQAIEDKASVLEMDDEADVDEAKPMIPDFSFDPDFLDEERGEPGDTTDVGVSVADTDGADPPGDDEESIFFTANQGTFQELLASPLVRDEAEDTAAPLRQLTARPTRSNVKAPVLRQQSKRVHVPGSRDDKEAKKYKGLLSYSNRLGGDDLYAFRDTVAAKRVREEDADTVEASYAKAKRIRAMKATTALKKKLTNIEHTTSNTSLFETILLLREENERKAEARREEEEQRRREERASTEARLAAEKAEAEERRRQERLEMEDRARRDREEARERMQEMLLLIKTLSKND